MGSDALVRAPVAPAPPFFFDRAFFAGVFRPRGFCFTADADAAADIWTVRVGWGCNACAEEEECGMRGQVARTRIDDVVSVVGGAHVRA